MAVAVSAITGVDSGNSALNSIIPSKSLTPVVINLMQERYFSTLDSTLISQMYMRHSTNLYIALFRPSWASSVQCSRCLIVVTT